MGQADQSTAAHGHSAGRRKLIKSATFNKLTADGYRVEGTKLFVLELLMWGHAYSVIGLRCTARHEWRASYGQHLVKAMRAGMSGESVCARVHAR